LAASSASAAVQPITRIRPPASARDLDNDALQTLFSMFYPEELHNRKRKDGMQAVCKQWRAVAILELHQRPKQREEKRRQEQKRRIVELNHQIHMEDLHMVERGCAHLVGMIRTPKAPLGLQADLLNEATLIRRMCALLDLQRPMFLIATDKDRETFGSMQAHCLEWITFFPMFIMLQSGEHIPRPMQNDLLRVVLAQSQVCDEAQRRLLIWPLCGLASSNNLDVGEPLWLLRDDDACTFLLDHARQYNPKDSIQTISKGQMFYGSVFATMVTRMCRGMARFSTQDVERMGRFLRQLELFIGEVARSNHIVSRDLLQPFRACMNHTAMKNFDASLMPSMDALWTPLLYKDCDVKRCVLEIVQHMVQDTQTHGRIEYKWFIRLFGYLATIPHYAVSDIMQVCAARILFRLFQVNHPELQPVFPKIAECVEFQHFVDFIETELEDADQQESMVLQLCKMLDTCHAMVRIEMCQRGTLRVLCRELNRCVVLGSETSIVISTILACLSDLTGHASAIISKSLRMSDLIAPLFLLSRNGSGEVQPLACKLLDTLWPSHTGPANA
jgi:hypothetical protein